MKAIGRYQASMRGLGTALALLASAPWASASEKMGMSLTNTGTAAVSEAVFEGLPEGTVVPTVVGQDEMGLPIEGAPLTALPSSEGVDIANTFVLLGTEDGPSGEPTETVFLLFGYEPNPAFDNNDPASSPFLPMVDTDGNRVGTLEPGGRFDFELNLSDPALMGLLTPTSAELDLDPIALTSGPDQGGTPVPDLDNEVTPIPEPSTLLIWLGGAVAGVFGLSRTRRMAKDRND